jgi:hypothetical protein
MLSWALRSAYAGTPRACQQDSQAAISLLCGLLAVRRSGGGSALTETSGRPPPARTNNPILLDGLPIGDILTVRAATSPCRVVSYFLTDVLASIPTWGYADSERMPVYRGNSSSPLDPSYVGVLLEKGA